MKCPLCREEISVIASVCPHCRSDLRDHYGKVGSPIPPSVIEFFAKLLVHTLMIFIPFYFLVAWAFGEPSGVIGFSALIGAIIIAVVFRKELPVL